MKYCEKCGAANEDGAKFCRKCGNRFKAKSNKSKYVLLLIISIAIAVVLVVICKNALVNEQQNPNTPEIIVPKPNVPSAPDKNLDLASWLEDLSWTENKLNEKDLRNLSPEDLRILRNAIFAKHGYIFKDPYLSEYFSKYSWYSPLMDNVYDELTNMEKRNVALIKSLE